MGFHIDFIHTFIGVQHYFIYNDLKIKYTSNNYGTLKESGLLARKPALRKGNMPRKQ